jgi:Tfp pilus assembly protein PilW
MMEIGIGSSHFKEKKRRDSQNNTAGEPERERNVARGM